jgi:predicted RNA binding protein YcfA (HicA-like mRNA interferase family)
MAALRPCKRRDFIRKLRALGYDGPFPGGSHQSMSKSKNSTRPSAQTVRVPNTDVDDVGLLRHILRNAKIDESDFSNA